MKEGSEGSEGRKVNEGSEGKIVHIVPLLLYTVTDDDPDNTDDTDDTDTAHQKTDDAKRQEDEMDIAMKNVFAPTENKHLLYGLDREGLRS